MAVFVVISVALALFALGLAVVAAVHLKRQAGALRVAVEQASKRIQPLTDELQAEAAVTATELEHLQRQVDERSNRGRKQQRPVH